jgi:predicted transcriptional regulator
MQAGDNLEYRESCNAQIGNKAVLIISEIGYSQITTATSFVEYIYDKYGFSKSCVWYNLKKLKQVGLLDFTEKDDKGKPLELTKNGISVLRKRYAMTSIAAVAKIS